MKYQNKLSRLRQTFLRIQGQDLKQVLLRAAAKRAEFIAENVFTAEEIFHEVSEKIYKATNELSWNEAFELVSDAESLAILKKELIEDVVQEFEWEETLFVLLEGLEGTERVLVESVLNNQNVYNRSHEATCTSSTDISGFTKLLIPIVRRIFADFPARHLVGVQPMNGPVGLAYTLQYKATDKAEDEDDTEEVGALDWDKPGRKITLEIIKQAVEAGARKLQAGWTIEASQDLVAFHGLNIEAEMIQALSREISQEINAEIIENLKILGGDADVIKLEGTEETKEMLLSIGINRHCNEIARKTRRGAGNFIVVSSATATLISESKKMNFEADTSHPSGYMSDLMLTGKINGGIRVFSALNFPDDEILVGYKGGNGEVDAGYIYCPYIPLMSAGVVVDATTFQPLVTLMTRYGKATIENAEDYYSNIKVEGLPK